MCFDNNFGKLLSLWTLCGDFHFSVKSGAPSNSMFPKYLGIISKGFLNALGACLVNLEWPLKLFICSEVLGELWSSQNFEVALSPYLKLVATMYPDGSQQKFEEMVKQYFH